MSLIINIVLILFFSSCNTSFRKFSKATDTTDKVDHSNIKNFNFTKLHNEIKVEEKEIYKNSSLIIDKSHNIESEEYRKILKLMISCLFLKSLGKDSLSINEFLKICIENKTIKHYKFNYIKSNEGEKDFFFILQNTKNGKIKIYNFITKYLIDLLKQDKYTLYFGIPKKDFQYFFCPFANNIIFTNEFSFSSNNLLFPQLKYYLQYENNINENGIVNLISSYYGNLEFYFSLEKLLKYEKDNKIFTFNKNILPKNIYSEYENQPLKKKYHNDQLSFNLHKFQILLLFNPFFVKDLKTDSQIIDSYYEDNKNQFKKTYIDFLKNKIMAEEQYNLAMIYHDINIDNLEDSEVYELFCNSVKKFDNGEIQSFLKKIREFLSKSICVEKNYILNNLNNLKRLFILNNLFYNNPKFGLNKYKLLKFLGEFTSNVKIHFERLVYPKLFIKFSMIQKINTYQFTLKKHVEKIVKFLINITITKI